MIVRSPHPQRDWTAFENTTLRDRRLSMKARGVLVWLLSMPADYRVSSDQLAKVGPDGRDAIRSALTELEATGYLVRRRVRTDDGTFTWETTIYREVLGQ